MAKQNNWTKRRDIFRPRWLQFRTRFEMVAHSTVKHNKYTRATHTHRAWMWMRMRMYPKMRDWFKPSTTITLFIPSFRRSFKSKKKLRAAFFFLISFAFFLCMFYVFVFVYVSEHLYITKYHVLYNSVASIVPYPSSAFATHLLNLPTKHIVTHTEKKF